MIAEAEQQTDSGLRIIVEEKECLGYCRLGLRVDVELPNGQKIRYAMEAGQGRYPTVINSIEDDSVQTIIRANLPSQE